MWKYNKLPDRQSGFTLVELAIVLVIIGLILAAVLKGQEMIENAKVKNVINDLRGVSTAYYAYQDRYKAIPGDDAHADQHFNGTNGDGNGLISGKYNATDTPVAGTTTESNKFWQHTRLAGFMTGSGSNPPTNALGGVTGVQNGATGSEIYGMIGPTACVNNIPWKIAQAVDTVIDDGNSDTGTVRAGATGDTVTGNSAAYGASGVPSAATMEALQTVCMKI